MKIAIKKTVPFRYLIVSLATICSFSSLFAYNHPEIKWKTVTTKHFYIHYYDKTEPAVYAAWKIAEEAFTALDSLYTFTAGTKIHLALADYDDYSNGFADWTQQSIMVWIPDDRFDLRSSTTWLREVIIHELAHIMSLERKRGMQLFDWTVAMEYVSPNVKLLYSEPIAMTPFSPMWFAEGTAQIRSEQLGGDCWDNRRDMILRCAVLDNALLSLDAMGNFTHGVIGNEKVYNQGYAFTKYIEQYLGLKGTARIWNENRGRKFFGRSLGRFLEQSFNVSLDDLYEKWVDSLRTAYRKVQTGSVTEIKPVWTQGNMNAVPRISPDGRYWGWLTNHKDDFYRTDLVIAPYGHSKPTARIRYAQTDWDFSPDGNTVYYIKARTPNRNGSYLNDIYAYSLSQNNEKRITRSARIYAVAVSPNGEELLCVQYKEHRFSVVRFSLKDNRFTPVIDGRAGEPFLNVSYLPSDPTHCIVSSIVNGKAGLFILNINNGSLDPLVCTEAQEERPFCAPDGRIYFSADYDGICNIYSLLPDGSDLKRHTSVRGGVFSPVVDKNGMLVVSEYSAGGFSIGTCTPSQEPYEVPNTSVCLFEPLPTPKGTVKIKAKAYRAQLLRPSWEIFTSLVCTDMDKALQDRVRHGEIRDSSWNIYLDFATDISMYRSDAVGHKDMYLGGAIVVNAGWNDDSGATDTATVRNRFSGITPALTHAFYNARPRSAIRENRKHFGRISPALQRDIFYITQQDTSGEDTTDDKGSSVNIPYLVPFVGMESRKLTPTIGVDAMVALVAMIPAMFNIDPYIEWHVARDLYLGVAPTFSIMPLLLFSGEEAGFGMTLPFWVQWEYYRYINEDISYNNAGVTSLRGYIGPEVIPYIEDQDTESSDSIDVTTVTALSFGVEGMHAFPFFKYSALSLSTENYGMRFNKAVSGSVRDIEFTDYIFLLTSESKAALIFPIIRNINRGRLYADNLYGTLFYKLDFYGTDEYFHRPRNDVFVDKDAAVTDAWVSHWIGLGVELGCIKNHTFGRNLIVKSAWDMLHKEFAVTLSFWFK